MRYLLCLTVMTFSLVGASVEAVITTFTVTNAYLRQIDDNTYRLRLAVSWKADELLMTDYGYDLPYSVTPKFDFFRTSLVGTNQRNATMFYDPIGWNWIADPGTWYVGDCQSSSIGFSLDYGNAQFGYDFDSDEPLTEVNVNWYASIIWREYGLFSGDEGLVYVAVSEGASFSSTATAQVVPEPSTLILLAFGVLPIALLSRRSRVF